MTNPACPHRANVVSIIEDGHGTGAGSRGLRKVVRGVQEDARGVAKDDHGVAKDDHGVVKDDHGVVKVDRGVVERHGGGAFVGDGEFIRRCGTGKGIRGLREGRSWRLPQGAGAIHQRINSRKGTYTFPPIL
jgi:hypothetical protein